MSYPLRDWGLSREDCGRIIVAAGLPLPPKSACFFCPSMKQAEIEQLEAEEPELYELACEMERGYRIGRHFKGDGVWTVKAKHRQTGELVDLEMRGESPADVRAKFRAAYDDTARPYKYAVDVNSVVVGLGRSFAWSNRRLVSLPVI